jgi:hypothetical protein
LELIELVQPVFHWIQLPIHHFLRAKGFTFPQKPSFDFVDKG